ncbi:MAG: ketoacyl-ACP synthase III [Pseudomonadota bacterium]
MAQAKINHCKIAGVVSCVPQTKIENTDLGEQFSMIEIRKITAMAGIQSRHVSNGQQTSVDFCLHAARDLVKGLQWDPASIDAIIMVTQTPDYHLPSSSCLIHKELGLSTNCAAFDVGLGCSGYPYGLWLSHLMIQGGMNRVLVLHGETPSLFTSPDDRATVLLFGDAGSATAIARDPNAENPAYFSLHSDGQGYTDLIIPAGGFRQRFSDQLRDYYVSMNGTNLFNFTILRLPPLIHDLSVMSQESIANIDAFIFHQSNRFIMKHIMKKAGLEEIKVPLTLEEFGNTGGPSVPLTLVQHALKNETFRAKTSRVSLLGYGVGLSWSGALVSMHTDTYYNHLEL